MERVGKNIKKFRQERKLSQKELADMTGYKTASICEIIEARTKFNATSYKRLSERLRREMNICLGAKLERNKIVEPVLTDFVPYFFRHTFCTDLKKKGVDIRLAKNLMGHADIKTTANIYDHDDDETLRLAAEQMGLVKFQSNSNVQ